MHGVSRDGSRTTRTASGSPARQGGRSLSRGHRREDRRSVDAAASTSRRWSTTRRASAGRRCARLTFHERALHAQGDGAVPHGAEGRVLPRLRGDRRDEDGFVDRHRGRHRDVLRVRAARAPRASRTRRSTSTGRPEPLSKGGTFVGRHICVPLEGVAVHINAFNFPVWGMLEKLAPTLLAGVPAIVKPATVTSYLTEAVFRAMIDVEDLPGGAIQLLCGSAGDLLDHLDCQSAVAFTGSASTGQMLKASKAIVEQQRALQHGSGLAQLLDARPRRGAGHAGVRSLHQGSRARDDGEGRTEVHGDPPHASCPSRMIDDVMARADEAARRRHDRRSGGRRRAHGAARRPRAGGRGAQERRRDRARRRSSSTATSTTSTSSARTDERARSSRRCCSTRSDPFGSAEPHDVEAFGPVNTVMPYDSVDDAIELAKQGKGSLVGSLFTADDDVARDVVLGTAAYHGRLHARESRQREGVDRSRLAAAASRARRSGSRRRRRGDGRRARRAALHAAHGAPGLADDAHARRRTSSRRARRGRPIACIRSASTSTSSRSATRSSRPRRTVTEADIVNFAGISGDFFYAHMDDIAARDSIFEKRVAHGYFVLSAAAGLFVDPAPGPGAGELRAREPALREAGLSGRHDSGDAHRQAEDGEGEASRTRCRRASSRGTSR